MAEIPIGGGLGVGQPGQGLDPLNPILTPGPVERIKAPPPPTRPPVRPPAPPVTPTRQPTGPTRLPGVPDLSRWLLAVGLASLLAALAEFLKWMFRFSAGNPPGKLPTDNLTPQILGPALTSPLGNAVKDTDTQIGIAFTRLAQDLTRLGRVIDELAEGEVILDQRIDRLGGHLADVKTLGEQAAASARTAGEAATRAASRATTEHQRATKSEAALRAQATGHADYIHRVIEPELERLRQRQQELERGHATTTSILGRHETLFGEAAVVAGVGLGLARLGAQWARCESPQVVGSALCASNPNNWRKLLKGALDILGIVELCAMVKHMGRLAKDDTITDGLGLFATGVEDLLTCSGATKPTPLAIPPPSLGPPTAWAELAA